MSYINKYYLSGILGKLKGHTQRLVMIMQAAVNATKFLELIGECLSLPLSQEFQSKVKNALTKSADDETKCYLNLHSTEKSICLAKYLTLLKKYLSGYTPGGVLQHTSLQIPQISKKILLYPGPIVPCNAITKSTRNTAEQVKDEMRSLCLLGLGETKHEKPQGGGRLIFTFIKQSTKDMPLENIVQMTNSLSRLGIDIKDFEDSFISNSENVPPTKKMKLQVVNSSPNQTVDM